MQEFAIKVKNISKRYRIGLKEELHDTIVNKIISLINPVSSLRKLQKLSNFNDDIKSKDIIWSLKDISFEVKKGEVLGIIGPNGAGKSTLLKVLSRITPPTNGRAILFGKVASLLEVGTGFHPELTGRENLYLNGTILGMKKKEIDIKYTDIVKFSGIDQFIDTPVKRYSSGMRVRLAFSIAVHLDPEILLIDEVLAVGDMFFQEKAKGKMEGLANDRGITTLIVSHNMNTISSLCTKALCISNGKVVEYGDVQSCIKHYFDLSSNKANNNHLVREKDMGRNVKITKISAKPSLIQFGDQINLIIEINSNRTFNSIYINCLIKNQSGLTVGQIIHDKPCSIEYNKTIEVKLSIDNNNGLIPGNYYLSCSITKNYNSLIGTKYVEKLDLIAEKQSFSIIGRHHSEDDGKQFSNWKSGWGLICFSTKMTFSEKNILSK
jgi:lipopolysaccharide transport system ATP-binding protein